MKRLFGLTVAAVIIFTAAVMAQPFGPGGMWNNNNPGFWKERIARALNLSDKQKAEFLKLRTNLQTKIVDLRAQIQKNNLKLKELYAATNLNESAIKKLINENTSIKGKIKALMVDNWFTMYKKLNKDQKPIFKRITGRIIQGMKARVRRAFARGKMKGRNKKAPCMQMR